MSLIIEGGGVNGCLVLVPDKLQAKSQFALILHWDLHSSLQFECQTFDCFRDFSIKRNI